MRVSLLKKLKDSSLPDSVIGPVCILLIAFVLSPFLGGLDFGPVKIPKIPNAGYFCAAGVILLILLIVPLFGGKEETTDSKSAAMEKLKFELNMLKSDISGFDADAPVNVLLPAKGETGLEQNPYLVYIKPLSKKFLDDPAVYEKLPKHILDPLENLICNKNSTIREALSSVDRILGALETSLNVKKS